MGCFQTRHRSVCDLFLPSHTLGGKEWRSPASRGIVCQEQHPAAVYLRSAAKSSLIRFTKDSLCVLFLCTSKRVEFQWSPPRWERKWNHSDLSTDKSIMTGRCVCVWGQYWLTGSSLSTHFRGKNLLLILIIKSQTISIVSKTEMKQHTTMTSNELP